MEDEQAAEPSWFRKTLHSGGSAFLIAFICNKATFPIRAPITVGLTPIVARCVALSAQPISGHIIVFVRFPHLNAAQTSCATT
jgi:hypothetical protein